LLKNIINKSILFYHNLLIIKTMDYTIFKAFAKLNLSLNILPYREQNGYYQIRFINAQLMLHDTIKVTLSRDGMVHINASSIDGEGNIAYLAAKLLLSHFGIRRGITLDIEKSIPIRAGLGGGSSDAAAVLNGLVQLFGLTISRNELIGIAKNLGMDTCYCVIGGLCKVGPTGENVEQLPYRLPPMDILIATPPVQKPSTAWAYSILNEAEIGKQMAKYENLLRSLESGSIDGIAENLHNDFELPIQRYYPVTQLIRERMLKSGAITAHLAGSGLSVFGIFTDREALQRAQMSLETEHFKCISTRLRP
jgi:4-diphosphocytidyl-2-C-methyl-D-erythritol kinase